MSQYLQDVLDRINFRPKDASSTHVTFDNIKGLNLEMQIYLVGSKPLSED